MDMLMHGHAQAEEACRVEKATRLIFRYRFEVD
jgi:hypothetical protein